MDSAKEQDVKVRLEILEGQLKLYIDVYKHHFDLFLKGIILYLAAVGAIASYVYREGSPTNIKGLLSLLVSVGSLVASVGCFVSWRWVRQIEERVIRISDQLGVDAFPFSGAKGIALVMTTIAALFCAAAFANFIFLK